MRLYIFGIIFRGRKRKLSPHLKSCMVGKLLKIQLRLGESTMALHRFIIIFITKYKDLLYMMHCAEIKSGRELYRVQKLWNWRLKKINHVMRHSNGISIPY